MYKFSQISEHALHGIGRRVLLPLEKLSGDLDDQLRRMTDAEGIHPGIRQWCQTNKLDHDNYVYGLVAPLGACESWGCTINGDGFEREWLRPKRDDWGHHTFVLHAKAYLHHKNKDPNIAFGDNPCMFWSDKMDRAEGIWRLDRNKAQQHGASFLLDKIENGRGVEISMGTHVPYDVCSICGNKAKTRADYCEHPRSVGFGNIDPDSGKLMQVLNPFPDFFDLSGVIIKAAPEALVLGNLHPEMVSSILGKEVVSSVSIVPYEQLSGTIMGGRTSKTSSVANRFKLSEIYKEIPALSSQVIPPLKRSRKSISTASMRRMKRSGANAAHFLSSCAACGIPVTYDEFRRAMGVFSDLPSLLPDTESNCNPPSDTADAFNAMLGQSCGFVQSEGVRPSLLDDLMGMADERSILLPFMPGRVERALQNTEPSVTIDIRVTGEEHLARSYGEYLADFVTQLPNIVECTAGTYPSHAASMYMPRREGTGYERCMKTSAAAAQVLLPALEVISLSGQMPSVAVLTRTIQATCDPRVAAVTTGSTLG